MVGLNVDHMILLNTFGDARIHGRTLGWVLEEPLLISIKAPSCEQNLVFCVYFLCIKGNLIALISQKNSIH